MRRSVLCIHSPCGPPPLRALEGVDVLFLRPALYYESIVAALDVVEATGVDADVVEPDVPVPMVSTRDVAEAAASALRSRDWTGHEVRELLGPCDLTYAEATRILGVAVGRPDLQYVPLPGDEMAAALVQAGFTPDTAALHVEMGKAISAGTIIPHEGRTPRTTTPTRFEDVVAELVSERQEAL
jgi:uncharacterized protein YbjT (DUF2867 family)